MKSKLPRGIAPDLLVSQVRNTAPYVFEGDGGALASFAPAVTVRAFQPESVLTHFEYFQLCLSAHYLTVATPVPTDVDNQIRQKLWPRELPLDIALPMADLVLSAHGWDSRLVSARYQYGPKGTAVEQEYLTGHKGEWFTVACGAYCALKQYDSAEARTKREEIFEKIKSEVNLHSEIFGALWKAGNGLGCLIGSASVAHNLGDLDRVMDMWELDFGDPLRLKFYKLGTTPFDPDRKLRYQGRLWIAGELYKETIDGSSMALENHRHYALRKPRALRESPRYLVPNGPFFDAWGARVALGLKNEPEKLKDVLEALQSGWERQPRSVGYGRALLGVYGVCPELAVTAHRAAQVTLNVDRAQFEARWSEAALVALDDIPSRA